MATAPKGKAKPAAKADAPKKRKPADVKLPPNAAGLPASAQREYKVAVAASGKLADGWAAVKKTHEKGEDGKWRKKGTAKKKVSPKNGNGK